MADLFLYGTLQYPELLSCVLGRDPDDLHIETATLADHQVLQVSGQPFPVIVAYDGARITGRLVRGLSTEDLEALEFYEGSFGYTLKPVSVALGTGGTCKAEVYFPDRALATDGPWDLAAWIEEWGDLSVRAAAEVMAYRGRMSPEEIATVFPSIRRRASAWLAAQARPEDPEHDLSLDVRVHRHKRAFMNFFAMEEMDLQFRRYDGTLSPVINRCVALVGRAAIVLPYDPLRDEVLLIEQFRAATFIAGEKRPWMWEPVAGLIDPGETPEDAALREAAEEAGLNVSRLEPVGEVYSSSGASGEFLHIFVGLTDLRDVQGGGGLDSENEDIRSKVISFRELMDGVDNRIYQDMPLVTAALWLARHRERLRALGRE